MNKFKQILVSGMIGLGCLFMWACPDANTVLKYLNIALTILQEAASISGVLSPQYVSYIAAGGGCLNVYATEIASTDSPAVQGVKIGASCAGLVAPTLPPGTAQTQLTEASKLGNAIADILAQLPKADAKKIELDPFKLSTRTKEKFVQVATKAEQTKVKFLAAHPLPVVK